MTAEKQFAVFLARYSPEIARCMRQALGKMRARLPGAVELVYDNYNALVVAFAPSERASEALFSLAGYPRWVTLFFGGGATLKDPAKLLQGSGKGIRHIVLESAGDLDRPEIGALIEQSLKRSGATFPARRRMTIRSVSAKQRPRQPAQKTVAKKPASKT